jgi:5-dehydro-2-deoxygluconokinase
MTLGYDKSLYILPFAHRGSFQTKMFGWTGRLRAEQIVEIAYAKQVIYDISKAALARGVPKDMAGILVDEQFSAVILRDAAAQGFITACPAEKSGQEEFDFQYGEDFAQHIEGITACPAEKSGQEEFDFQYGEDFAQHIEGFRPTLCKVLVCYNPKGDRALNKRQRDRLTKIVRLSARKQPKSIQCLSCWRRPRRLNSVPARLVGRGRNQEAGDA